ncbi:MAG: AraC family transcriptional regulator [Pseudomonadaceae bacterium]|nr:AraC family transcriptional regulator [Pseudomonadaceae bacterium]
MSNRYDKSSPVMMTASYLRGSMDAADQLGGNIGAALTMSGLTRQQLTDGEGLLPLHAVVTFLNQAANDLQCDTFALELVEQQSAESLSHIGKLVRFAPSFGQAITDALRFNILNSEYSDWQLTDDAGVATLERHTRVRYDAPLAQMQMLSVAVVHRALRALMQRDIDLKQVCFTHSCPRRADRVEQFFNAPVLHNATFNGLVFADSELTEPVPSADPAIHRLLCEHLGALASSRTPELDTLARLRHTLRREIGSEHCTLESVSQRWGIHPRRLQRKLQESGTSFRKVLRDVRLELAQNYLRDSSITVVELADILGYRNASAFSRAFKHNTGLAPELWRRAESQSERVAK